MDAKAKAKAALIELASSHLERAMRSLKVGDVNGVCEAEVEDALKVIKFANAMGGAK